MYSQPWLDEGAPQKVEKFPSPSPTKCGRFAHNRLHPMNCDMIRQVINRERVHMLPVVKNTAAVRTYRFQNTEILIVRGRCDEKAADAKNAADVPQSLLELFGRQMLDHFDEENDVNAPIRDRARYGVCQGDAAEKRVITTTLPNLINRFR